MSKGIVHISDPGGHRKAYLNLFVSLFGFNPMIATLTKDNFFTLIKREKVLFATVGPDFKKYFLISFFRSLLGKSSSILFLGAPQYSKGHKAYSSVINRLLIKFWKILPRQTIFAILPYDIDPTLSKVTTDFIYDPQMWDMWLYNKQPTFPKTNLSEMIKAKREDRKVLIFIGRGSKSKSFEKLVRFAKAYKSKIFVVAAGLISQECITEAAELRSLGMMVENRYISDDELLSLYGIADFAWCYYAPIYDQASGIFGRAVQLGVIPIIHSSSIIAKITDKFTIPSIKLKMEDYENLMNSEEDFLHATIYPLTFSERQNLFTKLRDESLNKVKKSLGLM